MDPIDLYLNLLLIYLELDSYDVGLFKVSFCKVSSYKIGFCEVGFFQVDVSNLINVTLIK